MPTHLKATCIFRYLTCCGAWIRSAARRVLTIDNGSYCVRPQYTEAQQGIKITQLHLSDVMRSRKSMFNLRVIICSLEFIVAPIILYFFFNLSFTLYPKSFFRAEIQSSNYLIGGNCVQHYCSLMVGGFFWFFLSLFQNKL